MLPMIHQAVRRLLYERGRIPSFDVDIRFAAPTRAWIDSLTRPTIDFFLLGVQENTDLRQTSFQSTRVNGRAERRLPPRRVDLTYMVSALASETDDEHLLLWRTLVTLMQFPELPTELLPDEVRDYNL